jgi:predicted dehydrogenase
MQPPSSHGGGYEVSERTSLWACSDLREDVMEEFGKRCDVPRERQYTDYRDMIEREQIDIVSVATQPEHRAGIVIYAAEHGIRAIYAEKAMAASLREADAMVEAVERSGAAFNLGANRRWSPHYDKVKEVLDSGRIGRLKALIIHDTGSLFNTASHNFDTAMRLNGDHPAAWVQGHLPDDSMIDGDFLRDDPTGQGIVQFENGVTLYAALTGRGSEYQAICENGSIYIMDDGARIEMRVPGPPDHRGRSTLAPGQFPEVEPASATLNIVEDLVHSLDTGEPTRGGVRVARADLELSFAIIESHRRVGARVEMPLEHRDLLLKRVGAPRQPRYRA